VAVLVGIALLYFLLAPPDQSGLSPSQVVLFLAIALVLVLAAFAPSVVRRLRGLRQAQLLSASDVGFCILVTVVGCALASFGVFLGIWWLTALAILLAPLSFIFRRPRVLRSVGNSPTGPTPRRVAERSSQ
jgi:hypothetical protein